MREARGREKWLASRVSPLTSQSSTEVPFGDATLLRKPSEINGLGRSVTRLLNYGQSISCSCNLSEILDERFSGLNCEHK